MSDNIPTRSSANRKYSFTHLKVGGSVRYPYEDHGRIRSAVCYANKHSESKFVCRVIRLANDEKKIFVQRVV